MNRARIEYTEPERAQIRENLRKIERYCQEHFVAKLRERKLTTVIRVPVTVDPDVETGAELVLSSNGILAYETNGTRFYWKDDGTDSVYNHPNEVEELLLDWDVVKDLIWRQMKEAAWRRDAMLRFEP